MKYKSVPLYIVLMAFVAFCLCPENQTPLKHNVFLAMFSLKYFVAVNLTERMKIQNISQPELLSRMRLM